MKRVIFVLVAVAVFAGGISDGTKSASAQTSPSKLYVPLIGISSVPEPLALPDGPGSVTYHYAVKNFLPEFPLTDIDVTDNKCSPVIYVEGDDNNDQKIDYSETWRYTCTIGLAETSQSIATAIGTANTLPAAHKAYTTVVVGSDKPAPLVNIINITKVSYPLTLPREGGNITFTYRVNNPGVVPLSDVIVSDNKCSAISNKLGDTNANNLLDINETWVYTCTTHLDKTTTNTATVTSFANGLQAVGYTTLTVTVATDDLDTATPSPDLPNTGDASGPNSNFNSIVWAALSGALVALCFFWVVTKKNTARKTRKKSK